MPDQTHQVLALVDVNLVLESMRSDQTRIGEWVTVIGYITDIEPASNLKGSTHVDPTVHAQAILVWSAGPFDIRRYEASLKALSQTDPAGHRGT